MYTLENDKNLLLNDNTKKLNNFVIMLKEKK